jgi:hypothetical protein
MGLLFVFICFAPMLSLAGVGHIISVDLQTGDAALRVTDTLSFDTPRQQFEFTLNAGFTVVADTGSLKRLGLSSDGLHARYRLTFETPTTGFRLQYRGQPGFSARRLHGGMPQGRIANDGVYLDGSSAWYPLFNEPLVGVELSVVLPAGWESVSIGRRTVSGQKQTWATQQPHDNLYLIAGPFQRYVRRHGELDVSVYLLQTDDELAARYLDRIGDYVDQYSRMIGPYPFAKFAVVENRWQTGYGMPSFTLLGSRVLRLPFILYTSLPHEILHNWWGNGVWVDYRRGNWSEGLTAYLADHWMQERRGQAATYRLKALQRYTNFAAEGADRPLITFVSRHNDASQSIGYSKALMLFHMLRMELGDDAFLEGLQRLWRQGAFKQLGFEDVLRILAGSDDTYAELAHWLYDTGAPRITIERAEVVQDGAEWRLHLAIRQNQENPLGLHLPLAITVAGDDEAREIRLPIHGAVYETSLRFDSQPLRLDIDPRYDLLRLLDATEQPPALNRLFGGDTWLVLPSAVDADKRQAWQQLAKAWQERYPGLRVVSDAERPRLPDEANLLVLGWENTMLNEARQRLLEEGHWLEDRALRLDNDQILGADEFAVVAVGIAADGRTTGFIGAPDKSGIASLARKLPHYGSYGRLVFDRDGRNTRKDALSPRHSRLTRQLGQQAVELRLADRPPLNPN